MNWENFLLRDFMVRITNCVHSLKFLNIYYYYYCWWCCWMFMWSVHCLLLHSYFQPHTSCKYIKTTNCPVGWDIFFCEGLLSGTVLFCQCPYGVAITMVTWYFMQYGIFYQKTLYKICPEFRWPAFSSTFFPCMINLLKCHAPPSYSFPLH